MKIRIPFIDKSTLKNQTGPKVIFLDIDGVMNHEHSTEDMDTDCLYQLKRIVDSTQAKIVLTSSWKMYFMDNENNPIKHYFTSRLKLFGLELYDIAPHIGTGKRALEIESWLNAHTEFQRYVIIDDNMFPGFNKMTDHICLTDWSNGGLTIKHADKAIRILNQ